MHNENKVQIKESSSASYIDSYYSATANSHESYACLKGQETADVCIIGGGYTGLSSAIHLAEKGFKVVVLEAARVAWGASGRNGGHVGTGQRKGQDELEKLVGKIRAKLLWDYSLEAVNTVEFLINKHNIQCDLKRGSMHVASKASHTNHMRSEVELLHNDYQYKDISYIEKDEIPHLVGSDNFHGGQLDTGCLHLHPMNLALGLAEAAFKAGVRIYENSKVLSYSESESVSESVSVKTSKGSVKSKYLILACNGYLGKLEPKIASKIMPINNFVLATEPLNTDLARTLIRDDVSVADSLFVINYWKLSGDNRLIFGGGENYSSRFPKDMKNFVRKHMLKIYPQLQDTTIDYAWGGTLAITLNRAPHVGRLSPKIYFAQGFSGHGVPTAIMAGKLMAEAVAGVSERFDVFATIPTHRFPGGTLLRWPGLVAGMLYYSLLDKL